MARQARQGMARHGRPGEAWQGGAWRGTAWQGGGWQGGRGWAWQGRQGGAGQGEARPGAAWQTRLAKVRAIDTGRQRPAQGENNGDEKGTGSRRSGRAAADRGGRAAPRNRGTDALYPPS